MPSQQLTANQRRHWNALLQQLVLAAETAQRARDEALALLLAGNNIPASGSDSASSSSSSSSHGSLSQADAYLLFANHIFGPLGAPLPRVGESVRELVEQMASNRAFAVHASCLTKLIEQCKSSAARRGEIAFELVGLHAPMRSSVELADLGLSNASSVSSSSSMSSSGLPGSGSHQSTAAESDSLLDAESWAAHEASSSSSSNSSHGATNIRDTPVAQPQHQHPHSGRRRTLCFVLPERLDFWALQTTVRSALEHRHAAQVQMLLCQLWGIVYLYIYII